MHDHTACMQATGCAGSAPVLSLAHVRWGAMLVMLSCVQEFRTSYPMRPIRPITPLADAAEEVGKHLLQQQRRSASTGKARQKQQHPHSWLYGSMGSSSASPGATDGGSGSDQSVPPAAKRLFQDAVVRMQRAEQTKEVTELAERKARSWSAPR